MWRRDRAGLLLCFISSLPVLGPVPSLPSRRLPPDGCCQVSPVCIVLSTWFIVSFPVQCGRVLRVPCSLYVNTPYCINQSQCELPSPAGSEPKPMLTYRLLEVPWAVADLISILRCLPSSRSNTTWLSQLHVTGYLFS